MNTRTLSASIRITVAAALMGPATLVAPAFAAPAATPEATTIQHTCEQTLGLTVNDSGYAACVATLTQARATSTQPQTPANTACADVGLAPGSADYGRCVANLDGALNQVLLAPN
ncbi:MULTISPECIES: hypothetical protein [Nitrospirillum]|uniref:Uncharacterized protein n=1 Tax=Nitrospirillum amazonense TaxID=28077 RepID=A0A560G547_9PROT|nr:hypothetical protein [Nitrospirillum amazonense]MEC4591387.1 hypothetical protein [Nitrospirillum amazonense]TWB28952.1 hypothetical protein FBZ88_104117 [Nitrospirillum amazonense]